MFNSAELVEVFTSHTKSTIEPQLTGTLKAIPSNLPFNFGNTLPTADAAPVLVGMIALVAERALLKSLCGES